MVTGSDGRRRLSQTMIPIRMVFPTKRAFTCNICLPMNLSKFANAAGVQSEDGALSMICLSIKSEPRNKTNKINITTTN